MVNPFRFGVVSAVAPSMADWRSQAREVEARGFSALYIYDHLDPQYGPLVATTVAAEATHDLHVGTLVFNNDLRNIVVLAREIATLGLAAEGRVEVGLGAGHHPGDYSAAGVAMLDAAGRVDRLEEALTVLRALLEEGQVSFTGRHLSVEGAVCDPRPDVAPRIIVGGASRRVLTLAAHKADVVNVNRVGAAKAGGDPNLMYAPDHYDRSVEVVRQAAGPRLGAVEFQITAAAVKVLSAGRAAARTAAMLGFIEPDVLSSPAVLIGPLDELCERLQSGRERWGFSNIVVPVEMMADLTPVVERLAGT